MSDHYKNLSGRHKQPYQLPLDNPEVSSKVDWWDELCKKEGVENHWKKRDSKAKSSDKDSK